MRLGRQVLVKHAIHGHVRVETKFAAGMSRSNRPMFRTAISHLYQLMTITCPRPPAPPACRDRDSSRPRRRHRLHLARHQHHQLRLRCLP